MLEHRAYPEAKGHNTHRGVQGKGYGGRTDGIVIVEEQRRDKLFSAPLKQVGTVQLLNSAQLTSQRYETESEQLFSSRSFSRFFCTSLLVSIFRRSGNESSVACIGVFCLVSLRFFFSVMMIVIHTHSSGELNMSRTQPNMHHQLSHSPCISSLPHGHRR